VRSTTSAAGRAPRRSRSGRRPSRPLHESVRCSASTRSAFLRAAHRIVRPRCSAQRSYSVCSLRGRGYQPLRDERAPALADAVGLDALYGLQPDGVASGGSPASGRGIGGLIMTARRLGHGLQELELLLADILARPCSSSTMQSQGRCRRSSRRCSPTWSPCQCSVGSRRCGPRRPLRPRDRSVA